MKKLIALVFAALLLVACAPATKTMSHFDKVYPLKGKVVVVVTEAHKELNDFSVSVNETLANMLSVSGVTAVPYVKDENSLALSENPIADFAKSQNAEFILFQTFSKVQLYNMALSDFQDELTLVSLQDKKPVWKASISWSDPMPFGNQAAVTAASDGVVDRLKVDGFITMQ